MLVSKLEVNVRCRQWAGAERRQRQRQRRPPPATVRFPLALHCSAVPLEDTQGHAQPQGLCSAWQRSSTHRKRPWPLCAGDRVAARSWLPGFLLETREGLAAGAAGCVVSCALLLLGPTALSMYHTRGKDSLRV